MNRALLVEDDGDDARRVAEILEERGSFQVQRAYRAEALLREEDSKGDPSKGDASDAEGSNVEASSADLVVTGQFLPRINGPELIRRLRKNGVSVPILLLIGRGGAEARAKGLRAGADDCLTRPAEPEVIVARARALLRRPPEWQRVDRIEVGALEARLPEEEAYVHGVPLGLRSKEFGLLYLLADRHPTVATRREIKTRVWGSEAVSPNSLDVTVSGLRDKIEKALPVGRSGPQVQAVRSVGYRLRAAGV
jgi:DNA-binding response OmpR family regulator